MDELTLRDYRMTTGMSQMEVAEAVGVPQTVLSRCEVNNAIPNLDMAMRVAEVLWVDWEELLGALAQPGRFSNPKPWLKVS